MIFNNNSRTTKTIFNTLTGTTGHAVSLLLGFVGRMVFLQYLAVELLGINSLFTSIIAVFSLAELGFSTAISYALYRPLSENNERKISALMQYYKKIYSIIGFVVLFLGIIILPFLQYFINNFEQINISLNDLRIYFIIFLISTVSTYFFAYKRTLIISDQKRFIVNIINIIISIINKITQILIIIFLQNFFLFLAINVIFIYLENIAINIIVDKRYKYLKIYKKEKLNSDEKKTLYVNILALFFTKTSSVFTTGIISIIISKFIGLKEVGLYSNYFLLTSAITTLIVKFNESATASVGNFAVTENIESQKELFKKILYFNSFFAIVFFVGLSILFNDFIEIWLGKEMILDRWLPLFMAINIFIWIIRNTLGIFFNAYGLYKYYYYRCFFEIIIFLGLALPGAIIFGISGVIGSQIIAIIIIQLPFEIFIISKYALQEKIKFIYNHLFKYLFITLICFCISYFVYFFLLPSGLIGFILKILFILLVVTSVYYITTYKTEEFKYYCNLFKNILIRSKKITSNQEIK
ncbi:MAG: hypothetical protein FWB86_01315 [Treponema sp.]|nr:hypothetical protein [Treponema sp.]MCL2250376.1 hypothetical protein [Treponema sp.]